MSQRNNPRDDSNFIFEFNFQQSNRRVGRQVYISQGELPPEAAQSTLYLDKDGQAISSEAGAAAMCIVEEGQSNYYVAVAAAGPNRGSVYNPVSVYAKTDDLDGEEAVSGRKNYEFKPVTEAVFSQYVHFLKSKMPSAYREVERAVFNG